jgi:endoglucanase
MSTIKRVRRSNRSQPGWLLRFALLALLAILIWGGNARAADEAAKPPWRPHRGVNVSAWLADAQRQPLSDHDFQVIKSAGFDHVRLPVNPEYLGFSLNEAATGRVLFDFAQVDQAMGLAMANGLAVILDISPSEGFLSLIEQDARAEAGFISLWQRLADHYKLFPPNTLAFEIINAPRYDDDVGHYSDLIADIVSSMRQIVPQHLIIVDAPKSASIDGLLAMKPLKDPNIEYAFQFFEPEIFTRQGMIYGTHNHSIRYFRNLPYPSANASSTANYAPKAADKAEAHQMVEEYALADWNAGRIQSRLHQAVDWAEANHTQIICTAFGARRAYINPISRYRWIGDTRRALDAGGISWDIWDFSDLFGIVRMEGDTITEPTDGSVRFVDPANGVREIEPDAANALFEP